MPAVGAVFGLRTVTQLHGVGGAWLDLIFTTLLVSVVMGLTLLMMRTPELTGALKTSVLGRLNRNSRSR